MVDSMAARRPGPVAAEQAQIVSPPPPCLTVDVLICCVWFSPNVLLCIMTKRLHFDFICPKDIVTRLVICLVVTLQT